MTVVTFLWLLARLINSIYTYRLRPNSKWGAACPTAAGALSGYTEQISWNFTRLLSWASRKNPGKLSPLQCIHPSQPAYSLLQSDMMHLFFLTVSGWFSFVLPRRQRATFSDSKTSDLPPVEIIYCLGAQGTRPRRMSGRSSLRRKKLAALPKYV